MPTTRSQAHTASERIIPGRVTRSKSKASASGTSHVNSISTQATSSTGVISPTPSPNPPFKTHRGLPQQEPAGQSEVHPASQPAVESRPAQKCGLIPPKKRKANAISRLGKLANLEIGHFEDVTTRAERRFKHRKYFTALAQNSQGSNHTLHPDYTLPHLIHGDTTYKYKINSPFVGMFVSQGTLIQIGDEDYVEYRVLAKPRF